MKTEQPLKNNTNRTPKIKAKIHKNGQKRDLNRLISKNREKTEAHTIESSNKQKQRKQRLIQ